MIKLIIFGPLNRFDIIQEKRIVFKDMNKVEKILKPETTFMFDLKFFSQERFIMKSFFCAFLTMISVMAQLRSIDRIKQDADSVLPYFKRYLPENPIILEAGGFDGEDTVKMAHVWPKSTIYVFEPVPELFNKMCTNIKGFNNIAAYNFALSDSIGFATFNISELQNNPNVASGSGSLLKPKETLTWDPHIHFNRTVDVQTITIDEWAHQHNVNHVDFLWLDMQGYELPALQHGTKLLETVKLIYIEVEFVEAYEGQYLYEDVKIWLEEKGFVEIARDFTIPPDWFWGNCVFVRR